MAFLTGDGRPWAVNRAALRAVTICSLLIANAVTAGAEDWPQWRGKDRLGIWTESGILDKFPEQGLDFQWRVAIGGGYSGPVVADGRVFVLDFHGSPDSDVLDGTERLLCLAANSGEMLWEHKWPVAYRVLMASYATGPRASATVDGLRVYAVGAVGNLFCLDVRSGAVIWKKDFVKELNTEIPTWGVASSPLVDGDRLICITGGEPDGKVMAFDKRTGKEIWRALSSDSEMGYAQPVITEAGGARQLIIWQPEALSSLNPATGKVFWEVPFVAGYGMTVATPVRDGSQLLVSHFYGGSMMVTLDPSRPAAKMLWKGKGRGEKPDRTDGLHALITTPILEGDYIYGLCSYGELRCLNAKTGERIWENLTMARNGRWGAAFMVRNGDRYFVNNDQGDLIIARFSPTGYEELDRTKLIEPTTNSGFGRARLYDSLVNWSHPAFANRCIFARNDNEIICASLEKK